MKVKELIEKLKDYDQETELFVSGYEGGWDKINVVYEVQMVLDVNTEWYYGSNEVLEEGKEAPKDKKVINGIIVKA